MRLSALALLVLLSGSPAYAGAITLDPGAEGSSYFYANHILTGVLGSTSMQGQTEAIDFIFSDNKFLAAGAVTMDLWINQDNPMGEWPTTASSVSAYLFDATYNPITPTMTFVHNGTMPTQIWPGWGYYLPDGTEYLPAATGYEGTFVGARIAEAPENDDYFLEAMLFHGIHMDITYPDSPDDHAIGLALSMSNFNHLNPTTHEFYNPLYVSPDPVPTFRVLAVPEPATALLLSVGAMVLLQSRRFMREK